MRAQWQAILQRYGQTVTLADGRELRAFVQPVRERDKAAPFQVTSLGTADDRKWIFLGDEELLPGQTAAVWDRVFAVENCQAVYAGSRPLYWWALLAPERERAE